MTLESAVFLTVFGTGAALVIVLRGLRHSRPGGGSSSYAARDTGDSYTPHHGYSSFGGSAPDSGPDNCSNSSASGGWDSGGCDSGGGDSGRGGGD